MKMKRNKTDIHSREKIKIIYVICAVAIIGLFFRFAFIWEVGLNTNLNVYLNQSDLYNYDIKARDLLREEPIGLKKIGYPVFIYYLKFFYQFFGTSALAFYVHQFMLSLLSVFLLYRIGKIYWGHIPGLLAALMFLFYKMNYLYDVLKLHTALSQFIIIACLYFYSSYKKSNKLSSYTGFIISGIFMLFIRLFFGLLFITGAAYLFFSEQQWKSKTKIILIIVCGVFFFIGYNLLQGTDTLHHKFGIHFYIGNHSKATGLFTPVEGVRTHSQGLAQDAILIAYKKTGDRNKINNYWIAKTLDSYKSSPFSVFKVLWRKINLFVNNYEPHNNASIYFYERKTNLKYYPRLDFAVIFAFAVSGVFLLFKNRDKGCYLFFLSLIIAVMILSVFFCSRYRMPIIPFYCLFAGYSFWQSWIIIKKKQYKLFVTTIALSIGAIIWSYQENRLLNKDQDIVFWQERFNQGVIIHQKRQEIQNRYQYWKEIAPSEKIQLTRDMGESGLLHEFFDVIDEAVLLANNADDINNYVYLLSMKASLLEEIFKYNEALNIWRRLSEIKLIKEIAEEKTKDLKVLSAIFEQG